MHHPCITRLETARLYGLKPDVLVRLNRMVEPKQPLVRIDGGTFRKASTYRGNG
jgi:hypothetical protein